MILFSGEKEEGCRLLLFSKGHFLISGSYLGDAGSRSIGGKTRIGTGTAFVEQQGRKTLSVGGTFYVHQPELGYQVCAGRYQICLSPALAEISKELFLL